MNITDINNITVYRNISLELSSADLEIMDKFSYYLRGVIFNDDCSLVFVIARNKLYFIEEDGKVNSYSTSDFYNEVKYIEKDGKGIIVAV